MSSEAKVGLFVIVALTIFVVAFLSVANIQLTGEKAPYKTYFAYIGGLDEGGLVRYGGRKAGIIRSVHPWADDPTKTEVIFDLRTDVPINRESRATIASLNALGQNYLEITPGSIDAPKVEPGGTIESIEALTFTDLTNKVADVADKAVELMGDVQEKLDLVVADADELLHNLNALTGKDNQENIKKLLANGNKLIEEQSPKIDRITSQIGSTLENVEELIAELRKVAEDADKTVRNVNRTVDETREPIKKDLAELERTLVQARETVAEVRALVIVNEQNINETIENFRIASENIELLTDDLRQRPWSLIRVKPKPDRQVPVPAAGR